MEQELILVNPSEEYLKELLDYRNEFLANGNSMDGCGPLRKFTDMKEYLNETNKYLNPATLPEGMVIATQFLCIRKSDNKLVEMIQVRHYFNEYLEKYAGHIGYSVRPSERRKDYASWMLNNIKPFCRSIGLDKILVCCLNNNVGSRKTILTNGGIYDGTVYNESQNKGLCSIGRTKTKSGRAETDKSKLNRKRVIELPEKVPAKCFKTV